MLMKSMFNVELDTQENGETVIYNTQKRTFIILSQDIKPIYDLELICEELIDDSELNDAIANLKENGFLVKYHRKEQ